MEPGASAKPDESRVFEAVAFGFVAVGILGLALEAAALRHFERMFADFGATLPGPTQLVIDVRLPHLSLAASLGLAVVAGLLLRIGNYRAEGRAVLVASALLAWAVALCSLFALYLPFIPQGGHIK